MSSERSSNRIDANDSLLKLQQHFEAVGLEAVDERLEESAYIAARVILTLSGRIEPPHGGLIHAPDWESELDTDLIGSR